MAIEPPLMAVPEAVSDLTAGEQAVWDSYQRFLHCIVFPGPLSYDGMVIAAALLALAAATSPTSNPLAAEPHDETQGLASGK